RVLPVEQTQLDKARVAVLVRRTVERQLVRGRAALERDELVQGARVTDLVLRDRREGDVLLEQRRNPGPLRVAPAENQLVVSDLEQRARFRLVHVPPCVSVSASSRRRGGSCG